MSLASYLCLCGVLFYSIFISVSFIRVRFVSNSPGHTIFASILNISVHKICSIYTHTLINHKTIRYKLLPRLLIPWEISAEKDIERKWEMRWNEHDGNHALCVRVLHTPFAMVTTTLAFKLAEPNQTQYHLYSNNIIYARTYVCIYNIQKLTQLHV